MIRSKIHEKSYKIGPKSTPIRSQIDENVPLGRFGVVLGGSWGLLGRSWAILGRSWGILRRSWVALGGSWFALGGSWLAPGRSWRAKRARRAAGQGASVGQGKRSQPPPSEIATLDPPQGSEHEGQGKRKTGLRTTGKREEPGPQGRGKSPQQGSLARPETQGAGG